MRSPELKPTSYTQSPISMSIEGASKTPCRGRERILLAHRGGGGIPPPSRQRPGALRPPPSCGSGTAPAVDNSVEFDGTAIMTWRIPSRNALGSSRSPGESR
jgi:hypothetical protein